MAGGASVAWNINLGIKPGSWLPGGLLFGQSVFHQHVEDLGDTSVERFARDFVLFADAEDSSVEFANLIVGDILAEAQASGARLFEPGGLEGEFHFGHRESAF